MHITNVIVSHFRSYREQAFGDGDGGLSRGVNVFVGRNGAGKSNFFAAVQLVLSPRFATLSLAERRSLLHAGAGGAHVALSFFVEVVFDNRDGRLVLPGQGDAAEVRIRRTVGVRQDDYRVNERRYSGDEVRQLLESAGLSSSNPYNIVEQGKIVALAAMSEAERYAVLRDVAGTRVYDARRRESARVLDETQAKCARVDALLGDLTRRLAELEDETGELRQLQEADAAKRCLEYRLAHLELDSANNALARLAAATGEAATHDNDNDDDDEDNEDDEASPLRACEAALRQAASKLVALEDEQAHVARDAAALAQRLAALDVDADVAARAHAQRDEVRRALTHEADALQRTLDAAHAEHASKQAALQHLVAQRRAREREAEAHALAVEQLRERRARAMRHTSKAERDAQLRRERAQHDELRTRAAREADDVDAALRRVSDELAQCTRNEHDDDGGAPSDNGDDAREAMAAAVAQRDELAAQRRTLLQQLHECEYALKQCTQEHHEVRYQLDRAVRYDIRQGLASLREVLQELRQQSDKGDARAAALVRAVHGPVLELLRVDDGFATAVEVTAGNALFHVVVDAFDVGAALLDEMNARRKPGRVSFLPLDTCRGRTRSDIACTSDCMPLRSKVTCDAHFAVVADELFGRTAVVTTLEAGMRAVRELHCDVVTLDGDQLAARGAIAGGYVERRSTKLALHARERATAAALQDAQRACEALCQRVAEVEQRIAEVLQTLDTLRARSSAVTNSAEAAARARAHAHEQRTRLQAQREQLQLRRDTLQQTLHSAQARIAALDDALRAPWRATWTSDDEAALTQQAAQLAREQHDVAELVVQVEQQASDVQALDVQRAHLQQRLAAVRAQLHDLDARTHDTDDDSSSNDEGDATSDTRAHGAHARQALHREHAALTQRLQTLAASADAASKAKQALEEQLEQLRTGHVVDAAARAQRTAAQERTHAQAAMLLQQRDEALAKLRRCGAAPAGVEAYADYSLGKVLHHLQRVNEQLRAYAHVNRNAVEQHTALLTARDELQAQRDTLARERASIHDLIDHLDKQKSEVIARTYKQIQYQFETVVKELVGVDDCVAELQLVERDTAVTTSHNGSDGAPRSAADEHDRKSDSAVGVGVVDDDDAFVGVRIRVSFGVGAPVTELEQLSGGQKSLVALALIFAIQRCDPAPFYLFDEIDAALDAEYRVAVARLIRRQAESCQFIVATFRHELLDVADKVYGIFFHNKISRIRAITRDEGMRMLQQAAAATTQAHADA